MSSRHSCSESLSGLVSARSWCRWWRLWQNPGVNLNVYKTELRKQVLPRLARDAIPGLWERPSSLCTPFIPLLGLSGQGAKAIAPFCPSWLSDCLLDLVYFRASATTFALPRFPSRSLDRKPGQAVVKSWTRTQHSAPLPGKGTKIATGGWIGIQWQNSSTIVCKIAKDKY